MNLSLFIARRYLFSKRKKNFINIISILSMVVVGLTTAALIVVLSVFNGLGDLLRSLNNAFDSELKIEAVEGKSFHATPELLKKVRSLEGVAAVTEVIEDYAYVRYHDANQIITLKGVSDEFISQKRIPEQNMIEGHFRLRDGEVPYALVGNGIKNTLSISTKGNLYSLQLYYINSLKPSSFDPSSLYSQQNILPGGVFSIVANIDDNYVIVPLSIAQELLHYGDKRTALEIKVANSYSIAAIQKALRDALGEDFKVLNGDEQHVDLFKILKMEKLFAFLALSLLLGIGSINTFFTLMMLALDKKKDIAILAAMGADQGLISKVFLIEGVLISFFGAGLGLFLGAGLCWAQMKFGLVSMGMQSAVTEGYPVKLSLFDFLWTLLVVVVITILISFKPARMASRYTSVNNL